MGAVWSSLLAAVLVLALLTVVPGPDVAVVTRVALGSGRLAAARTAAGIAAGCLVWGGLIAAGLAAILAASAEAYAVVKLVGAAYLVFLGMQTLWRSRVVWLNTYAALLYGARGTLTRPRVRRAIERVTGEILIGFGVRIALSGNSAGSRPGPVS